MIRFTVFAAGGLAVAALAFPGAQAPAPPATTFKAGVDLVPVEISVLDKDRRPVRGLTAADFTVEEDGKSRPIAAFTAVDLPPQQPPSAPWLTDIAPDVATNVLGDQGRLVVILMDRSIANDQQQIARKIATQAVSELRPGDLAAVVYVLSGTPQDFTADHARLLDAITRPFLGMAPDDATSSGQCYCGICGVETMTNIANAMRDLPKRRKLLLFLGSDVPIEATGTCEVPVKTARNDLIRAAGVAGMSIDAFDTAALQSLAANADARKPVGDAMGANLVRQADLGVFPGHTGGRTVLNTNDPEERVPNVFQETESYYVLGFPPADSRADGRYHEIKVKVDRKGASVSSRQGFYAPGGRPATPEPKAVPDMPQPLVDALAGFMPKVALPLQMTTASFATPGRPEASVAVVLDADVPADAMKSAAAATSGPRQVNVLAGAFGRSGHSLDYQRATLSVVPGASRYEVVFRLSLKPGRYEIRAGADDPAVSLTGSVYGYTTVPDFSKTGLLLSDAIVEAAPALPRPAVSPMSDLLPVQPTARRAFAPSDQVGAFVRLYQGGHDALAPVAVTATILDTSGRNVFERSEPVGVDRFDVNRTSDYRLALPVSTLAAGEYVLTLEFARGRDRATRDVRFAVR